MIKSLNLSIIIVSYNVTNKLLNCFKLIKNYPDSEVIIIDNNSNYKVQNFIKQKIINNKKVIYIENKNNLGFSKAVNQGIKLSQGKYILLLNPDTTPSIKAIKILLDYFDNHSSDKIGLIGGQMLKPHSKKIHGTYVNKPQFLTGIFEFTNLKKIFKNNIYSKNFYYSHIKINKPKNVYGLSGGFLCINKKIIKKVGLFDENFFMYLEDVDYGIRTRNKGYKVIYLPNSKIIHDSGSSSSKSPYKINVSAWRKSRNYFFKKYFSVCKYIILLLFFTIDDFLIDLKHIIKNESLS